MTDDYIYLDTAATCPPDPQLIDFVFMKTKTKPYANPSSAHNGGRKARHLIDISRERIAKSINCEPEEVYFTSGATEACNWAIKNLFAACANIIHPEVNTEHEAVRAAVEAYVAYGLPNRGNPACSHPNGYYKMLANNETGDIYDMPKRQNVDDLIFTDATAAVGNIAVDFKALNVDYMAFAGHKFGGLPGAGCLIVKKGAPLIPLIVGGGQEAGMRGGTENLPAIYSMDLALQQRPNCAVAHTFQTERKKMLKAQFMDGLEQIDLCIANFGENKGLYNIINIRIYGVSGATLAMMLSERGIMVSTGAACHSNDESPSKTLKAIGLTDEEALSSIRISFDHRLAFEQCKKAVEEIKNCVEWLRKKGDVQ